MAMVMAMAMAIDCFDSKLIMKKYFIIKRYFLMNRLN